MAGKEFDDFIAGKKFEYNKGAEKKRIFFDKPIRHDWFEGSQYNFELLLREDWAALEALHEDAYTELQADVLVNYTDTEECNNVHECIRALQKLQKAHMDAGEPDIKHNFLVGGDGHIYEGRGWYVKPPFDPKWPDISNCMINVALIGKRGLFPRKDMAKLAFEFIDYGTKDVGCLQQNVGMYLDYFDDDVQMTQELYNQLHTKEGNEMDEQDLPKHYRQETRPPWETKEKRGGR